MNIYHMQTRFKPIKLNYRKNKSINTHLNQLKYQYFFQASISLKYIHYNLKFKY